MRTSEEDIVAGNDAEAGAQVIADVKDAVKLIEAGSQFMLVVLETNGVEGPIAADTPIHVMAALDTNEGYEIVHAAYHRLERASRGQDPKTATIHAALFPEAADPDED
jgi:hypothetical protein